MPPTSRWSSRTGCRQRSPTHCTACARCPMKSGWRPGSRATGGSGCEHDAAVRAQSGGRPVDVEIHRGDVAGQRFWLRCVPDLTALATMDPPYYPKYATAAAAAVDGTSDPVVVVGHSAAGALLPAIAE